MFPSLCAVARVFGIVLLAGSLALMRIAEAAPIVTDSPEANSFSQVRDMTWGGGQYVAVGAQGLILTSADGRTWTTRRWVESRDRPVPELDEVVYGAGRYIAIARSGECLTSIDGVFWSTVAAQPLQGWLPRRLRSIAGTVYFIGGRFVPGAMEETALLSSTDGLSWRRLSTPPGVLADVAGHDAERLLLTRHGLVYRARGEAPWETARALAIDGYFVGGTDHRLAWNGAVYVAVQNIGDGTVFSVSADGLVWKRKVFSGFARLYSSLIWNGRAFVAGGSDGVAVSRNGEDWSFRAPHPGRYWLAMSPVLAGAGGQTVALSSTPALLLSANDLDWQGLTGAIRLPAIGQSRSYAFEDLPVLARTEREEQTRERWAQVLAVGLIGFALSGLSLVLYLWLQVRAIRRLHGGWRVVGAVPVLFVIPIMVLTIVGLIHRSNLWPIPLVLFMPLAVLYLMLILSMQTVAAKLGRLPARGAPATTP